VSAAQETRRITCANWQRAITTPLLIMDLLLTAGLSWRTVLWTCLVDEIMIVCGLVGALTVSGYKWGESSSCSPPLHWCKVVGLCH